MLAAMHTATATVATERPARYLKQLVSHMGRHRGGEVGPDGVGVFTTKLGAVVTLTPTPGALVIHVAADDAELLAGGKDAVARHLIRFATQEQLSVEWTDAG